MGGFNNEYGYLGSCLITIAMVYDGIDGIGYNGVLMVP